MQYFPYRTIFYHSNNPINYSSRTCANGLMRKLNILFDATILGDSLRDNTSRTGIFFVAHNLVKYLLDDPRAALYIYCRADMRQVLTGFLRQEFGHDFSGSIRSEGDDLADMHVYLSPYAPVPSHVRRFPAVICFTVLHDIIPLLFPEYFQAGHTGWFSELVRSINHDDFYFAVSHHTKQDFIKYVPAIDPGKVTVTHLAADRRFFPDHDPARLQAVRQKYGIPEGTRYLFSFCTLEPRKNLIRAVSAFIAFIRKNDIDNFVYLIGGTAWDNFIGRIEQEVPGFRQYAHRIIRTGYLPDEDLATLVSNAEWFVYTSQYEGFGMPPLEAMQCGCPVIVSNNSSLPEVVGDAGLSIDYDSLEQHVEAYEKYYFDPALRRANAARGMERARRFTWERCIGTLLGTMIEVDRRRHEQPPVTVITVTHNNLEARNGAQRLKQCIESVHAQTYRDVEHIVIDLASTDGTPGLLEGYEERGWIRLCHEPATGVYEALNRGIGHARGTYINFLDSNDYFHDNDGIGLSVAQILTRQAGFSYGDARVPAGKGKPSLRQGDIQRLLTGTHFCFGTMLVHAGVLKQLGGFDTSCTASADSDLVIRIHAAGCKHTHVGCCFLTSRSSNLPARHSEEARHEHSASFFRHIGCHIGLTTYDCHALWHGGLFTESPLDRQISLIGKIPPGYGSAYLVQELAKNKQVNSGMRLFFRRHPVVKKKSNPKKVSYDLFNTLRLLKITVNKGTRKYYLLGIIPVWRAKAAEA